MYKKVGRQFFLEEPWISKVYSNFKQKTKSESDRPEKFWIRIRPKYPDPQKPWYV